MHTVYVYSVAAQSSVTDNSPQGTSSAELNTIIEKLKANAGVNRVTFDAATGTLTVLTDSSVNLEEIIVELNKNSDHE